MSKHIVYIHFNSFTSRWLWKILLKSKYAYGTIHIPLAKYLICFTLPFHLIILLSVLLHLTLVRQTYSPTWHWDVKHTLPLNTRSLGVLYVTLRLLYKSYSRITHIPSGNITFRYTNGRSFYVIFLLLLLKLQTHLHKWQDILEL